MLTLRILGFKQYNRPAKLSTTFSNTRMITLLSPLPNYKCKTTSIRKLMKQGTTTDLVYETNQTSQASRCCSIKIKRKSRLEQIA